MYVEERPLSLKLPKPHKEGYGISICREITNNYPALVNKYTGVFSNYFMANNAIEEVLNQRKDKLFYL